MTIQEKAKNAKHVAPLLSSLTKEQKNNALRHIQTLLQKEQERIFKANREDLEQARSEQLAKPLLKRLGFQEEKLADILKGIESTIALEDPCNRTIGKTLLDDGLELHRVTTAIGVIGMIFESRPDALVQIATLCLKSGNCIMLKGGKEAVRTNQVLVDLITEAGNNAGLPSGWIHLVETRDEVAEMLALDKYIDLLIPRGSNEFVRYIMDNSRIPVLGHADGICHVYVDADADPEMAVKITRDSKTQYVAVCNAAETLLVHRDIAQTVLPALERAIPEVELIGCKETCAIIDAVRATEKDWVEEYLDYRLSIRIVGSLDEAIEHINTFGSGHTDAIVTANRDAAEKFMNLVDSADVFWNCSTRFSDGYRYGLGAEIGVSTSKIHARGPVGLDGLVIYKWKMFGSGQIVADYAGSHGKAYKHTRIM
ncbi:MAG: glutamate-5-semialdehyde dehydrogenase [Spirochaetales bacterium]|nr:glutamate-5-semialdehyde dehydrogenase [Spirochaetales bacterium]